MAQAQKLYVEAVDSPQGCSALDVDFLNRNTFDDVSLRNEIIGLFFAQLDGVQKNLKLPLDAEAWHYLTHTLKGAASAVGAQQIMNLAESWGRLAPPTTLAGRAHCEMQLTAVLIAFKRATDKLSA